MSIFEQGDLLAQQGMDAAEAGADEGWLRAAHWVVKQLVAEGETFTTDIVWARLDKLGVTTSEPRALGAVMSTALRAGHIRSVGYVKSTRKECHSRPIPVYLPAQTALRAS